MTLVCDILVGGTAFLLCVWSRYSPGYVPGHFPPCGHGVMAGSVHLGGVLVRFPGISQLCCAAWIMMRFVGSV